MPDGWENRQIVFIVRVEAEQQFLSEIPYVGAILSLVSARILYILLVYIYYTNIISFGFTLHSCHIAQINLFLFSIILFTIYHLVFWGAADALISFI